MSLLIKDQNKQIYKNMLSKNFLKHKQIVIINSLQTKFSLENDNLLQTDIESKKITKLNLHNIFSIIFVGHCTITTFLIKRTKELGISLIFCNGNFKSYSAIRPFAEANYLLRQKQYSSDTEQELRLAKIIINNKVHNQIKLLRSKKLSVEEQDKIESIVSKANNFQELLGIEGNFAKMYFKSYFEPLGWRRRSPRTKEDIPNLLLDIGYTYLFNFVDNILMLYGFDTYKGIYHKLFFGRKSLTCDLVEPFRPIIDRQLLKAFNLKQIDEKDFEVDRNGCYTLPFKNAKKYNKLLLEAIMDNKLEIFETIQSYYRLVSDPKNEYKPFKI
jgi:CRISP-associated protein Cas1